jgi:hypothetical protein
MARFRRRQLGRDLRLSLSRTSRGRLTLAASSSLEQKDALADAREPLFSCWYETNAKRQRPARRLIRYRSPRQRT